jgi:PTH1 family peptidyl-tRNA hydrolase
VKTRKSIIGLGNIGKKYENTRHNLGFDVLNILAAKWGIEPVRGKGDYFFSEKDLNGVAVTLVWPATYMNNSGLAASQLLEENKDKGLTIKDLLIVYDDFELPLGKIRIRLKGSDGGHNGMASIIQHLGTEDIMRLKLGIGPIPSGTDPVLFVLSRFAPNELEIKNKMLDKGAEAILYLLNNNAEKAMSLYNQSQGNGIENDNPAPEEKE